MRSGLLALTAAAAGAVAARDGPAQVLVTGYGDFLQYTDNPSGETALALDGNCSTAVGGAPFCFQGVSLPVNETGAASVAEQLQAYGPDGNPWAAVLHMGLEDSAKGLRLETVAFNVRADAGYGGWNCDIPCDDHDGYIAPGGSCLLPTTAPMSFLNIEAALARAGLSGADGVDEYWSRDAGAYYCNEIYYRTLGVVRSWPAEQMVPVIFVHLPDADVATVEQDAELVTAIAEQLLVYGGGAGSPW